MQKSLLFLVSVLLFACGETKSLEDASASSPSTDTPTEAVSSEVASTAPCLSECNPLDDLRFDFGPDISLALIDCKVLDYKAFALTDKYQLIIKANCLQGIQVYAVTFDKDGKVPSTPTVLSNPCASTFKDIKGFAAASLGSDIGVVYTCLHSTSTAKTWFSKLGGAPTLIETFASTYSDIDYDLKASWNPDAQILAVASKRGLIRVNSQGLPLGGTINLNLSKPIQALTNVAGQWFIISRENYAYVGTKSYCSKVLSNGQLACDKKEFGGPWTQIASNGLVLQATPTYLPTVGFGISAFNPETCSIGPAQDMGTQSQNGFALQSSGVLKPGFGWALSSTDNGQISGLTLNIYELHLAGKIQSTLAVADGDVTRAQALSEGNGLAIFYLDDLGTVHLRKGAL